MKIMMTIDRPMMPMSSMMTGTQTMMPGSASSMNMMMIPRCMIEIQKCEGGMKMMMTSEDSMAAGMLQNLCSMMGGSMMSACMMMNGMMQASFNMTMGMCKCEMMKNGVCVTWTSGDVQCCKMIQECCDCMMSMMKCGCTCCMCMNNTPVCCGNCAC